MKDACDLPTELETMSVDYWFPKFVMSTLLLAACPLFLNREHPLSFIISAGSAVGGLLLLSLTRVKPETDVIKYRRFFRWRPKPYSQITGCSAFWILGFISTREYVFPLGLIVFVLPREKKRDYRWDKGIIYFIRKRITADAGLR